MSVYFNVFRRLLNIERISCLVTNYTCGWSPTGDTCRDVCRAGSVSNELRIIFFVFPFHYRDILSKENTVNVVLLPQTSILGHMGGVITKDKGSTHPRSSYDLVSPEEFLIGHTVVLCIILCAN